MGSSTNSLTHRLNLTSNVNWRVNIFSVDAYDECVLFVYCEWVVVVVVAAVTEFVRVAMQVCCIQRDVQRGPICFSSSSYQVITSSPLKYQHGAGTLVMVETRHRSSCNYDSFLLPLLYLHNQLHQGWNNWFSIYANGMDLERRGANTQPCCLSGMTFKMEGRKCKIPVR